MSIHLSLVSYLASDLELSQLHTVIPIKHTELNRSLAIASSLVVYVMVFTVTDFSRNSHIVATVYPLRFLATPPLQ